MYALLVSLSETVTRIVQMCLMRLLLLDGLTVTFHDHVTISDLMLGVLNSCMNLTFIGQQLNLVMFLIRCIDLNIIFPNCKSLNGVKY